MAHSKHESLCVSFEFSNADAAKAEEMKCELEHVIRSEEFTRLLKRSVAQRDHILAGPESRQCAVKVSCSVNSGGGGQCTAEVSCTFG